MRRTIVIGALGVLAGATVLGAVFGPDVYAGYRFEEAFGRHFADVRTDAGPWPQMQSVCAFCHGPSGRSKNARYPSLAGQSEAYLEAQLHAFATGARRNTQMSSLAGQLSEDQVKRLATYYAGQTPERNQVPAADPALDGQGKAVIAVRSCAACHGEALAGGPLAPRLAGQGETYLADQLSALRTGARQDPSGAMHAVAVQLSDQEIRAAAHYGAGLAPARP